jgi:tetratricopeptide (TPR) repeat protein
VNELLLGLLGALLATNSPAALSNVVHQKTGLAVPVTDPNDPAEVAYQKLLAEDDAAQAEADRWILEAKEKEDAGDNLAATTLRNRIRQRLDAVKRAYQRFLEQHPGHVRARIAYGSFLNDTHEEAEAEKQWLQARDLDPKQPAAWNNLANFYGHNGDVKKSFDYYARAIELSPAEPVYYQNLATTVYLFRRDAMEHFKITEPEVFEKSFVLYRKALALDPENFLLATDYAQSYYGVKVPVQTDTNAHQRAERKLADDALAAWRTALPLARDDLEREGVHVHFARWQINSGRFDDARRSLSLVTNPILHKTRTQLEKKLTNREAQATNAPARPSAAP